MKINIKQDASVIVWKY